VKRAGFVAALVGCAAVARAQQEPTPQTRLERAAWPAQWITAEGAPERDPVVLHFRKVVTLDEVPARFVVYVSADQRFVLHVNGRRVGVGPARGDVPHWRFETFDLAPLLKRGANVLAATVWSFGLEAPYAQMTARTAFLVQGDDDAAKAANTDKTWQVEIEAGHAANPAGLRPLREKYFFYAAGPAERRDARAYDWGWDGPPGAATSRWRPASSLGRGNPRTIRDGAPHALSPSGWLLVPDPLPPMEEVPLPMGKVVRASGATIAPEFPASGGAVVPARSSARILIDRGAVTNGYPELAVRGGRDAIVRLSYAESLFDAQGRKGNRNEIEGKQLIGLYDELVADGAARRFEPLWWRSFRYVQLDVTTAGEPLTIEGLAARSTLFPLELRASFATDDAQLDELWQMAFRTLRVSANETYMDSPYWEQLQYVGDTRITALLSYALADEERLARQAIVAFDESRTYEGLTYSRYPSRELQFIPPYSLFWIGMVHDFWMYRNDPAFVRGRLPGVRAVLDWFLRRQRPDGLLAYVPYWSHVDPAAGGARQADEGGSAAVTAQLVAALREAAELEQALGEPTRAKTFRDRAGVAAAALAKLWDEPRGLLADNPAHTGFSHDVNILALWQDVVPPARRARLADEVLALGRKPPGRRPANGEVAPASLYFRWYLHKALAHAGRGDEFVSLLGPWREMLGLGLTTFPEFSDPTRSDSHAWTAHPALDFLTTIAGINPGAPGFARARIEPHLGSLGKVSARWPHPAGAIDVAYERTDAGVRATVTLPAGVPGELVWHGRKTPLAAGATKTLVLPLKPPAPSRP
jgi:hypothetical protein